MEDQKIPYVMHESDMARMERGQKRLWIVLIITIALLFITNAVWVYEWNAYDFEEGYVDVTSDDGIANYIGNNGRAIGVIDNGTY